MDVDLEKERLELEKRRLEFEIEKHRASIKYEHYKILAIFVPLLIVGLSFMVDSHNKGVDYQNQLALKKLEATDSFKLKAAEIIMGANTPPKIYNRARVLRAVFPEYLDDKFADSFDPESVSSPAKMDLAQLIIDHPSQRKEIIDLWVCIYPGDSKWANQWRDINNTTRVKDDELIDVLDTAIYDPWNIMGIDARIGTVNSTHRDIQHVL